MLNLRKLTVTAIALMTMAGFGPAVKAAAIFSGTSDATIDSVSLLEEDVWTYSPTAKVVNGAPVFSTSGEDIDAFHFVSYDTFYLSTSATASIGGDSFSSGDLVYVDISGSPTRTIVVPTTGENIDAAYVSPTGQYYLSWSADQIINVTSVDASDVWIYDPIAGDVVSQVFDGGTIFTDGDSENLDGFHVLPDGNFLLSTSASAQIGALSFTSGDIVLYDVNTLTASLYLAESTLNPSPSFSSGGIDAISFVPEPASLAFVSLGGLMLLKRRRTA